MSPCEEVIYVCSWRQGSRFWNRVLENTTDKTKRDSSIFQTLPERIMLFKSSAKMWPVEIKFYEYTKPLSLRAKTMGLVYSRLGRIKESVSSTLQRHKPEHLTVTPGESQHLSRSAILASQKIRISWSSICRGKQTYITYKRVQQIFNKPSSSDLFLKFP